jgi:hypothetical protein
LTPLRPRRAIRDDSDSVVALETGCVKEAANGAGFEERRFGSVCTRTFSHVELAGKCSATNRFDLWSE